MTDASMFPSFFVWDALSDNEARALLSQLAGALAPGRLDALALTARATALPFYPRHRLCWFEFRRAHGEPLHAFALCAPDRGVPLDGSGAAVHAVNRAENLVLDPAQRADYLRFFLFAVRGDQGPFVPLERAADLELAADATLEAPDSVDAMPASELAARLQPIAKLREADDGRTIFDATLFYQDSVFRSELAVAASGDVEMLHDEPLARGVPPSAVPSLPPITPLRLAIASSPQPADVDRDTTVALVQIMVEESVLAASGHKLLDRFNVETQSTGPLERLRKFMHSSWPIVVIESSLPFAEEIVAELLFADANGRIGEQLVRARTDDHDDTRLRLSLADHDRAIALISLHVYRTLADVQRVAHDLSLRDHAALIGVERLADLPEPLRRLTDLVLTLPRMDQRLFARLFERVIGAPCPPTTDAHWMRYVLPSDFHQPRKFAFDPHESLAYIRERVSARLREVDPSSGPGLRDLHGLAEAMAIAEDLIADIHAARAGSIPWRAVDRGMLLAGPPGTGKTTLAKALAKESGLRFVNASASAWQSAGHLGDHIRAMKQSFAEARNYAPSILFIDEIDGIGNRELFTGSNAQYHIEVVNALLEQIQGLDEEAPVIIIGATNDPARVDPALRRAGRLDRVVGLPYPSVDALSSIFAYYLREHAQRGALGTDIDTHTLGALSFGLTGADVELMVRGAARRARKANRAMSQADLIAEVTGKPRSNEHGGRLTAAERERIATHEAGHALSRFLGSTRGGDITFVSIIPRANGTLGFVASLPSERYLMTRGEYLELLQIVLAGRAAEEIEFGAEGISGGAGGGSRRSDLAVATQIATDLVCRLAFAPNGGLAWSEAPNGAQHGEIERLLADAYAGVVAKLNAARAQLRALKAALLEQHELTGDEVRRVLAGETRSNQPTR